MNSCIDKKDFDMDRLAAGTYEPINAIPIANSKLTMWDIVKDYDSLHLVEEDSTHFLTLVYRGERKSNFGENALDFSDTSFVSSLDFSIPGGSPVTGSVTLPEITESFIFITPNGNEEFDSLFLTSGSINIVMDAGNLNHNADIVITIPSIKRGGVPISQTISYTGQSTVNSTIDLSNSVVYFEHPTPYANQITFSYVITINGTGNPNNSPYNVSLEQSFESLEYSVLYGYLGQPEFVIDPDTIFVELFDNHLIGALDFKFKQPKLILDIENSIGIPSYLDVERLVAKSNVNDSVEVNINTIDINSPTIDQVGEKALTHREYDNVDEAVNISPQCFIYKVNPVLNPQGDNGEQNFVMDTSNINIKAKVELPLWGTINQFVLQDTFDFKFENYKEIDWIEFKIVAENWFPVDAKIQLYMVDSNYNILDSAITDANQIIDAGIPTSENDEVEIPTIKVNIPPRFENSTERVENLEKTRYFFIRGDLKTYEDGGTLPEVKFYSYYNLNIKVGLRVKMKTEFNL